MKKVLLVEDEVVITVSVSLILEAEGYEVITASNGEEGLELAKNEAPDLIITDQMMPRMDGLTMIRAIRALGIQVPTILCTSIAESQLSVDQERPYNAYLSKPLHESVLLQAVRKWLHKA